MMSRASPRRWPPVDCCEPAYLDYLVKGVKHEVRAMGMKSVVLVLGLAVGVLTACDSGSEQKQTEKEHVWKEQTGAIDKAREVEKILQRSEEEKKQ